VEFLSGVEISDWLASVGQIEDPYTGDREPPIRIQFDAPRHYRHIEAFIRCFLSEVATSDKLLIVLTDSEPAEESQRFVHQCLRICEGEKRPVEVVPGILLSGEEAEKAIALFTLFSSFGWKGYLYSTRDQIVLYNWEGEIFDFWTSSEQKMNELMRIIRNFGLNEVSKDSDS